MAANYHLTPNQMKSEVKMKTKHRMTREQRLATALIRIAEHCEAERSRFALFVASKARNALSK